MTRSFNLYGFDDLDGVTRTFILVCIALAYPAWDLGFQLGAFERVFYDKILFVWAISTALLLALTVNPSTRSSVPVSFSTYSAMVLRRRRTTRSDTQASWLRNSNLYSAKRPPVSRPRAMSSVFD